MKNDRYIRQRILKEFGSKAQQKLEEAKILVVGAGGLGIPVLQYLNAMGVGTLGIVEQDIVALSNLQRQVMYSENDLGRSKLEVVLEKLRAQNSDTSLKAYDTFLVKDNALEIITGFDLVVDASDNFPTRYLINDACVILKKPFVYGALHGFEGQLCTFNYKGGPTYRCLFPEMPSSEEIPDCDEHGVLGVIPGIIGNLQALEAVKIITGIGEVMSGKLLIYNGLNNEILKMDFHKVPENLNRSSLEQNYGMESCFNGLNISTQEIQKLLNSKNVLQLVDVRSVDEFKTYHLEGSVNIPFEELKSRVGEINGERSIYLICQSGKRSVLAQQQLQPLFAKSQIYNITGGINDYRLICS